LKDNSGIASTNNNMGGIYMYQGNYEEALKCYTSSLQIKEKRKDKLGIANSLGNIGGIYELTKQYDKALEEYKTALKLYLEVEDKRGIATSYSNMGIVYADNKKYGDAIQEETRALSIRRVMEDKEGIATSCIHLAESEIQTKDYTGAQKHLDEALRIARGIGDKEAIKNTYLTKSTLNEAQHAFREAFDNYKSYIVYRDSLVNEANTKRNVETKMQFDFDKKEALTRAEQEKKDVVARQDKQKQKFILLGVTAVLILVFVFSIFLYKRFKVTQRQKKIIEAQKEVVEQKNSIIEEKQKEILDSINYAKRIQLALLASESLLEEHLPDYFVLFKPKDIVAGDFYWASNSPEGFLYITADCTGHGVPGAFMSLLNISKLSEAINQKHIIRPDLILNDVRTEIIHALNPPGSNEESKDGMDCVLCKLDLKAMKLQFAAANDSLLILRDGAFIHCRADKMPVGKYTDTLLPFTYNEIELHKGDIIYTYTDGYADQFGGLHGKKLKYKPFEEMLLSIAKLPMREQKEALDKAFDQWKGEYDQVDDVCIMGVRI
jgi:serine phosphatase RsbU (regulator of sigma subunit)/Tfp pilus assembly protein PilF